jgi:hypothetical protein
LVVSFKSLVGEKDFLANLFLGSSQGLSKEMADVVDVLFEFRLQY